MAKKIAKKSVRRSVSKKRQTSPIFWVVAGFIVVLVAGALYAFQSLPSLLPIEDTSSILPNPPPVVAPPVGKLILRGELNKCLPVKSHDSGSQCPGPGFKGEDGNYYLLSGLTEADMSKLDTTTFTSGSSSHHVIVTGSFSAGTDDPTLDVAGTITVESIQWVDEGS